jgi:hypothetical protein
MRSNKARSCSVISERTEGDNFPVEQALACSNAENRSHGISKVYRSMFQSGRVTCFGYERIGASWLAWLRGCVVAWLRGCVVAWLRGCVVAWLRGSIAVITLEGDPS